MTDPAHPRDAMIAVKMNDQPLPAEHGFPARLIVPGLYGYVSATKWLAELELTTLEAFDAYWVPRGWAKEAPILTQSRIDVPALGSCVRGGRVQVAGVAWAPDRGHRRRSRSRSTAASGSTRRWRRPIGPQTWVQWKLGLAGGARATTSSRSARRTAPARSRPTRSPGRTPTAPAATTGSRPVG